jgi:hypothetical protein
MIAIQMRHVSRSTVPTTACASEDTLEMGPTVATSTSAREAEMIATTTQPARTQMDRLHANVCQVSRAMVRTALTSMSVLVLIFMIAIPMQHVPI